MLYYSSFRSLDSALSAMAESREPLFIDHDIELERPLILNKFEYVCLLGKKSKFIAAPGFPENKMIYINVTKQGFVHLEGLVFDSVNVPNSKQGQANDTVYIDSAREVNVTDCYFDSGNKGSDSLLFVSDATNVYINSNVFNGARDCAIYISGKKGYGKNAFIMNNAFYESDVGTIFKRRFKQAFVKDNVYENCRIGVATGEADGYKLPGDMLYVENNFILDAEKAISLKLQTGTVVKNNNIRQLGKTHNPAVGIDLQGCEHCIVQDNIIEKNSLSKIYEVRQGNWRFNDKVYHNGENIVKNNVAFNF